MAAGETAPPRFNLGVIERKAEAIRRGVLRATEGTKIDTSVAFSGLVGAVSAHLPTVRTKVLQDSIEYCIGHTVMPALAKGLGWCLAGNLTGLKAGEAARPWIGQAPGTKDWVVVRVEDYRALRKPASKSHFSYMVVLELFVLAGSPAGHTLEFRCSDRFLHVMTKEIGFAKYRGARWGGHPGELTQMRITVELGAPDPRFGERCRILRYWPGAHEAHNRQLANLRKENCPRGHRRLCYACHVGYRECPAGTHPDTCVVGLCRTCNTDHQPLYGGTRHCVRCVLYNKIPKSEWEAIL